jgi:hypothetical protein
LVEMGIDESDEEEDTEEKEDNSLFTLQKHDG